MSPRLQSTCLAIATCVSVAQAGPYSPPAGFLDSVAIPAASPRFTAWATGYTNYVVGTHCYEMFQTPLRALGPATSDVFDVVSLGRGGHITLRFNPPITDGPSHDFAVFENAITPTFLEVAFVEVSSDGTTFARFASDSLTAGPIGPFFDPIDSTDIDGLAGTFSVSYGTPFDLADLPPTPGLDPNHIRWVRIVDVVGDGTQLDGGGDPIFDPYPTEQSAGFDLEAIGVIHQALDPVVQVHAHGLAIAITTGLNRVYQLEFSPDLIQPAAWTPIGPAWTGDGQAHSMVHTNPPATGAYRIRLTTEEAP